MLRNESDSNEVETQQTRNTVETMRITGEYAEIAPDLFRFGRGRYRKVEFKIRHPEQTFSVRSEAVEEVVIGREDPSFNYRPSIDLTTIGGKLFGVSRRHATLNNQNGLLFVTDHNTTNGTYVNGNRLEPEIPHVLTHGDNLQIGRVQIQVQFSDKVLST